VIEKINITIPVFNRINETIRSISALKKNTSEPYILNVVDNGSDFQMIDVLSSLYKDKIIDNLFLLNKNYGVSCACNTGFRLIEADLYIKIDNDIIITRNDWLKQLLAVLSSVKFPSVLGHYYENNIADGENTIAIDINSCKIYQNVNVLPGFCFIIPKFVLDHIGFFCEDYGVYGEEDTDYCFRLKAAGIPMHAVDMNQFMYEQRYNNVYDAKKVHKNKLNIINRGNAQRPGLLMCNRFLYDFCLKNINVPLRYNAKRISEHKVIIEENAEYAIYRRKFLQCKAALTRHLHGRGIKGIDELLISMKQIMTGFC